MITVVITMPESVDREADRICAMLSEGEVDYVHLRKPSWTEADMERLIKAIPSHCHPRLKLHSCFSLLADYGLGGVHLNSRCPSVSEELFGMDRRIKLSRSCHSFDEVVVADRDGGWEYLTLSPVFSSISKPGYHANMLLLNEDACAALGRLSTPVVALGGVTPDRFPMLERLGYSGVAMLGYVWNQPY